MQNETLEELTAEFSSYENLTKVHYELSKNSLNEFYNQRMTFFYWDKSFEVFMKIYNNYYDKLDGITDRMLELHSYVGMKKEA